MSPRWTKEERYLITAYEHAMKKGDLNTILDKYFIGNQCSLSPKAINTICNLLAKTNLLKKKGETEIIVTKNGEELALRLRSEH